MEIHDWTKKFVSLQDFLKKHKKISGEIVLGKNSQENIYFLDRDLCVRKLSCKNLSQFGFDEKQEPVKSIGKEDSAECVNLKFNLLEGAQLNFVFAFMVSSSTKFVFEFIMSGENSSAKVSGFYLGENIKIETLQRHLVKNTHTQVHVNGALLKNSSVEYRGKIFVAQDACSVKAEQKNKNIILGENIFIDASPELEVLDNNVECKHGCAVGQFDKNKIFYLQSRGLDYCQAAGLMLEGFYSFLGEVGHQIRDKIQIKDQDIRGEK